MTNDLIRRGYAVPLRRRRSMARHAVCMQLIAAVALVLSLAVAVTAVSIGIARAGSSTALTTIITWVG